MTVSNEACNEPQTVELNNEAIYPKTALTISSTSFFLSKVEMLAGCSDVKAGQMLTMYIQHHQMCYVVLTKVSE